MSRPFGEGPQARPLAATVAFRLCASTLYQPKTAKVYALERPRVQLAPSGFCNFVAAGGKRSNFRKISALAAP
jgi:hypothetical protein